MSVYNIIYRIANVIDLLPYVGSTAHISKQKNFGAGIFLQCFFEYTELDFIQACFSGLRFYRVSFSNTGVESSRSDILKSYKLDPQMGIVWVLAFLNISNPMKLSCRTPEHSIYLIQLAI